MSLQGIEFNRHGPALDQSPALSERFFSDPDLTRGFSESLSSAPRMSDTSAGDLVMTSAFAVGDAPAPAASSSEPLLNDTIKDQITRADSMTLSTSAENAAAGKEPDYRVVTGEDGSMVLEKVGDGDPLADGELNIETDTGNKSLTEALQSKDKSVKEYYRELIAAFQSKHPGKDYPGWWNDILNSEPAIPQNAQPVPIRPAQQPRQQSEIPFRDQPQYQPQLPGGGGGGGASGGGNFGGAGRGGGDGRGAGFNPGGQYRGDDGGSRRASSGGTPNADQQTVLDNVRTVVEVAREHGVDPKLAVAMMLVESGGDNRAVGDNGTSFGLFQLHHGGMLTEAGLTPEQAYDPRTNAEVSIGNLAKIDQNYSNPGRAAAASQRPADPAGYAVKVNNSMDEAAELIAMAESQGPAVAQNDTGSDRRTTRTS